MQNNQYLCSGNKKGGIYERFTIEHGHLSQFGGYFRG